MYPDPGLANTGYQCHRASSSSGGRHPAPWIHKRGHASFPRVPRRLLIGRERFQESDQLCSALRRCQTAVRLHAVAGHYPVGVRDEALEIFLIPNEVGAPHSARIRVVWQRPCFSSDDASHVGPSRLSPSLIEWHVRQALLNLTGPMWPLHPPIQKGCTVPNRRSRLPGRPVLTHYAQTPLSTQFGQAFKAGLTNPRCVFQDCLEHRFKPAP